MRERSPGRSRAAQNFRQAAVAAAGTDAVIGAFFCRMRARKVSLPAVVAIAHRIARIAHAMLKTRTAYEEMGAVSLAERHRVRVLRKLERRAAAFGLPLVAGAPSPSRWRHFMRFFIESSRPDVPCRPR